jgi:hypothetical protein
MSKNFLKKQDSIDAKSSAKGCGGADDISEPLPCVDYAQAKPTEVDVGKQEKELAGMQVCEPPWSVVL